MRRGREREIRQLKGQKREAKKYIVRDIDREMHKGLGSTNV